MGYDIMLEECTQNIASALRNAILKMNHILNKFRMIFRCSKIFASILVEHVEANNAHDLLYETCD